MTENEQPLTSWKEIAAYLQRAPRTVRRWEAEENLPIHRIQHAVRNSVYAYPSELDAWREGRKPDPESEPERMALWGNPLSSFATATLLLLALLWVGNTASEVQAQGVPTGTTDTLVWATGSILPGISPDGAFVTFDDWAGAAGNLGRHDLASGTERLLTHSTDSSWVEGSVVSPSGEQVAYTWFDYSGPGEFQIRTVSTDGTGPPRIVYRNPSERYVFVSSWTPDETSLLIVRALEDNRKQVAMVDTEDGSVHEIRSFEWEWLSARLSPDGRYIAYDATPEGQPARNIFLMTADGAQETLVVGHAADDSSPIWSPDGARLLFVSDRTGQPSLWSVPVQDGKAAGDAELIKSGIAELVGMTKTGGLFYTVSGRARRDIYSAALGADGKVVSEPEPVSDDYVHSNWGATLSPDGQSLAFYSQRPGPTLVIRNSESGQERTFLIDMGRIKEAPGEPGPQWFPDSDAVLVWVEQNDQLGRVFFRVNAETGAAERLGVSKANFVRLAPDGRSFLYRADASTRLKRFEFESGLESVLLEADQGSHISDFAFSPDGHELAYSLQVGDEGRHFEVMPSAGGQSRLVYRDALAHGLARFNALSWTPDSEYLLFVNDDDSGVNTIWRVPVNGGEAEPLGVQMDRHIKLPQMSPDGERLYFTTMGDGSELWKLENFLPQTGN